MGHYALVPRPVATTAEVAVQADPMLETRSEMYGDWVLETRGRPLHLVSLKPQDDEPKSGQTRMQTNWHGQFQDSGWLDRTTVRWWRHNDGAWAVGGWDRSR
jgi:hypothetical protein